MQSILNKTEYLPVIIDSMLDMVRVVRADGTVAMTNAAMRKQFGETEGKTCFAAIGCAQKCEGCMMESVKGAKSTVSKERAINGRSFSIKASPLTAADGSFLGVVEVFRDITDDVALRERLIRANNKLLEDLSMARGLQRSMFRKRFPAVGEYSFTMGFYPCEAVGGDACDCIPLKDGRLLIYVADVSGHGVRAAMLTVFLKQEIAMRAKQTERLELSVLLTELRSAFLELNAGESTYITLFMAIVDTNTGRIECVNAGHSVAPLLKTDSGIEEIFMPGSPLCRWSDHAGGRMCGCELKRGGRLLLFTDGIMDIAGEDSSSLLMRRFSSEPFSAESFIRDIKELHRCNPIDDLLMLICERRAV